MEMWLVSVRVAIVAVQLVVLAGLVWRRRTRAVRLLPLYLTVTAIAHLLRVVSPDAARSWDYWALKELLLRLLTAGVVVEIAIRVFAHLPEARRLAWGALVLVGIGTLLAVWRAPGLAGGPVAGSWRSVVVLEVLPRLAVGSILLCAATLGAMALYRVPIDALHRVVLIGLALFLLVYAGPMGSADIHTIGRFVVYYVTPPAYLVMLVVWAVVAWKRESEPDVLPAVLRRVQPWRGPGRC
jgi:hypothetical protein